MIGRGAVRSFTGRAGRFFVDAYLAVDARTLALFRVVFGLHLIVNLYDRTRGPDGVAFYTNGGLLPNHYALFAPMGSRSWSLLFPFSSPAEVQVAFTSILLVYVAYVLGYKTKLAQIATIVCLVSLDNRNLILQNGGIVVTNLLAVWTAFLPLGSWFSLDRLLATSGVGPGVREAPRGPLRHARLAYFGILVNFAAIYAFNYAHKQGVTWRDGSAVHRVLWQNRIATIGAAWVRMHEPSWLSPVLTRATLVIEASLPLLLLSPLFRKWTRRGAILGIVALHGGIAASMTLGPFSYSMMAFALLLISTDDWDLLARHGIPGSRLRAIAAKIERRFRALSRRPAPATARGPTGAERAKLFLGRWFGEAGSVVLFACVLVELGMDNWAVPERYRIKNRPEVMGAVIDYLRIPQGWGMFSPEAPMGDGTIVVDAVLDDGRHLDPLTHKPPDFEAPLHGPWFQDQQWCDYFLRIQSPSSAEFYPFFRDYIASLSERSDWSEGSGIRRFDVYWVSNTPPPMGSTDQRDLERRILFSGGRGP